MALTNHERVGKALDLLKQGLLPFVERELKNTYQDDAQEQARKFAGKDPLLRNKPLAQWDVAALLKLMWEAWNEVFRNTLSHAERSLVSELRDVQKKWANQQNFSSDDAYRALDSVERLLTAISASEAQEVGKMRMELLRVRFDEQLRAEKRKSAGTAIEGLFTGTLKPWREVIHPHADVASGRYQQAEFAADLWQVYLGEGADEYRHPVEFFRRTYLTESLKRLLVGAVQRLSGNGGDPVVQLQTNFGGGKTHSMLALYHLVSGTPASELQGVEDLLAEAGVPTLPTARRVVLVGNKISPGRPVTKPDGTVVRTLWGELAWQLGGKKAFAKVREDDERGTSPGDVLRELFNEYAPCLVLIDEWVAYARQLHDQGDLPGGSFETQFTFAQTLTESAKAARNCLLVISLPASDTMSPHSHADDAEVGGERGREALVRLRNVVGRVESSWRPASAEESFEIVRRRLFEPMTDPAQFKQRDLVARTFADWYRSQQQEFPPECRDADYEKRLRAAYPIHPEVFDRLYTDWSTLVKFQRTRGVLRLMAAVIYSLWEKGDRNPLIMPSTIPLDDPRVQFELTRHLSDNWSPVIEKDVDGPHSLPLRIDNDTPNLGKFAACRRVARTIFLGSAPTHTAANRGIEDRRIKLGCVMPGESPAVFGDALRRLARDATYLYQDGSRYWYSTQPTVAKLAEDRAEQLKRDPDKVVQEIERRVRDNVRKKEDWGDFCGVHAFPRSSLDVSDDYEARLVVLGVDHPYSKEPDNPAEKEALSILANRGGGPRYNQNALVFLAVDKVRLQDLDDAVRRYLAWESIVAEREILNLSHHQVKQAEQQKKAADEVVEARLPEAYRWLLVPFQRNPQEQISLQVFPLSGQEPLAVRASKKLRNEELLATAYSATNLRMELDKVPLWRGDHVSIRQLIEHFARYPYLQRLKHPSVLLEAIRNGVRLLTWERDSFAFAESYDETTGRYRGLQCARELPQLTVDSPGLVVKPVVARRQLESEMVTTTTPTQSRATTAETMSGSSRRANAPVDSGPIVPTAPRPPKRFYGTVTLDPARVGRDAARVAEEVIGHLAGLQSAKVNVTLEIEAHVPDGVPDHVVRTVTENCRTLKFDSHGFESE